MTDDLPLAELLELYAIREGKEPSRALPKNQYGNPERQTRMKGARMHLISALGKLKAWWIYTRLRDRDQGYPSVAPYCKESKSSRQWETTEELIDGWCHNDEMERIDTLIDSMDGVHKAAIVAEMRNQEAARVWRTNGTFERALEEIASLLLYEKII